MPERLIDNRLSIPQTENIFKSISIIEKCRNIHSYWIDKIKEGRKTSEEIRIGGDIDWHQKWVDDYNFVIDTLKSKL